jgi:Holliday junction DNA helicase RuvA
MIACLKGAVEARLPDHVVLDCGGVGYRLNVSTQTLKAVPAIGRSARLLTHLVLRDDALHLYGFASDEERDLFLKLTSVAGVGPKMALAVLSGSAPAEVTRAIAMGDAKRFQVVPGVGKKTAERIIVELRDKLAESLTALGNGAVEGRTVARDGLMALGYDVGEAERMLDALDESALAEAEPEELITAALRSAVKVER